MIDDDYLFYQRREAVGRASGVDGLRGLGRTTGRESYGLGPQSRIRHLYQAIS